MGLAPTRNRRRTLSGFIRALLLAAAAAMFAAGCATHGPRRASVRALAPLPAAPAGCTGAADAVLAAFFAANGLDVPPDERADILPSAVVRDRIDRGALLRAARRRDRIAATVPAGPDGLWDALDRNLPLLLYLPGGRRGATLAMPVAWDREGGRIRLLTGAEPPAEMPEERFFGMRDPIGNTALCLVTPRGLGRLPVPERDRTRLLADFHFGQGDYRRAAALYERLLADAGAAPPEETVHALCGLADSCVRRGEPARAVPHYRRALQLDPDNPRLHNNLAYALLLDGRDLAEALSHAGTACRLEPDNPLFLETAGALHLAAGDCTAAASTLERAWSRARNHPPAVQAAICDQLTRAWLCADRPDLARQVAAHRAAAWPEVPLPADLADAYPGLARP